jgi:hypothetical protein
MCFVRLPLRGIVASQLAYDLGLQSLGYDGDTNN